MNRIQVLATRNDNVFLPIYKVNKSVFILLSHVSSVKPAILQALSCSFIVVKITFHNARTFDDEFSHIALLNFLAIRCHNLSLPAVASDSNCSHLVNILNSQVHTTRTNRLAKSIVCIVIVIWEMLFPCFN